MVATPESYSEAKIAQEQMLQEGNMYLLQYRAALSQMQMALQKLEAMEVKWAGVRQFIADAAAAHPDDDGYQSLLGEDARVHADYQRLLWRVRTVYDAADAARNKVPE